MTDSHKQALAAGRAQSKAVGDYLEALQTVKPKRGRKRTPDSIQKRLAAIKEARRRSALKQLLLVQEQSDLRAELEGFSESVNLDEYEKAFVKHAKDYAVSKKIGYHAFRSVGVPADVLTKAGIAEARQPERLTDPQRASADGFRHVHGALLLVIFVFGQVWLEFRQKRQLGHSLLSVSGSRNISSARAKTLARNRPIITKDPLRPDRPELDIYRISELSFPMTVTPLHGESIANPLKTDNLTESSREFACGIGLPASSTT